MRSVCARSLARLALASLTLAAAAASAAVLAPTRVEVCFRLLHGGLEALRIDLKQAIAGFHRLIILNRYRDNRA